MKMDRRQSARARGYDGRWAKARLAYLAEHPLCCRCQETGTIEPATVVDHIQPHRGDPKLFWDRKNWQPLCASHHNSHKQREERRGHRIGVTVEGRPVDPDHPWNVKPA